MAWAIKSDLHLVSGLRNRIIWYSTCDSVVSHLHPRSCSHIWCLAEIREYPAWGRTGKWMSPSKMDNTSSQRMLTQLKVLKGSLECRQLTCSEKKLGTFYKKVLDLHPWMVSNRWCLRWAYLESVAVLGKGKDWRKSYLCASYFFLVDMLSILSCLCCGSELDPQPLTV